MARSSDGYDTHGLRLPSESWRLRVDAAELRRLRMGLLSSFMPRRRLRTRPVIAKARARSVGSLASSAWANGADAGYMRQCTYGCILAYEKHGRRRAATGRTHRKYFLRRVVELAGELLVEDPLASKGVEEIWKGVEPVVMSGAESVEDFGRVGVCVGVDDCGGGGGRSGGRVAAECVHGG